MIKEIKHKDNSQFCANKLLYIILNHFFLDLNLKYYHDPKRIDAYSALFSKFQDLFYLKKQEQYVNVEYFQKLQPFFLALFENVKK